MIVIVEKDRVHMAVPIVRMGEIEELHLTKSDLLKAENLPIWKIKGKKNAIMGGYYNFRQNDIVRYNKSLFGKSINLQTLSNITIKAIEEAYSQDALIDEASRSNAYYIAVKNKAYVIAYGFVREIEEYSAEGVYDDMVISILNNNKDMSCDDKLRLIGRSASEYFGSPMLPMAVIDTKTETVRIVE